MLSCIFSCFNSPTKIETPKPLSLQDLFIRSGKSKFLSLDREKHNSNIEKEFYDLESYNQMMMVQDNQLEISWKRRILFSKYHRGSVFMYYDAYKMAFVYYGAENLPYSVVNILALDYVRKFHCLDFFVDEELYEENHENPLISIHYKPLKKTPVGDTKTTDTTNTTDLSNNTTSSQKSKIENGPFIKRKRLQEESKTTTKPNEESKQSTESEEKKSKPNYNRNKFVYAGSTRNFTPIQKPKRQSGFNSSTLNNIKTNMSWADYKASLL